jgi:ATP-dependent DNA helicase DinG
VRGGPDLEAEWATLCEALDEVSREAERLGAGVGAADTLGRRAGELRGALGRVLEREDTAHVYGMELRGRTSVLLSASPIDVSARLAESLFSTLHACVLTSATLAVEGRFDFFRRRLGLGAAEARIVESSFDYPSQALLYLAPDMPEPGDPAFIGRAVAEIVRLLELSRGRAFLLFTSYAHLERVHAALAGLGRWPLFVQGAGSKAALVDAFRVTPEAVLLGTTSFWHGVDVPGASLSLVVIDRLPFDAPGDPIVAARIERIREEQGNPFVDYQLPLAVLELKQGLGRLLRSGSDRGILAVLDPRLSTRRYGKSFLRSLPPYRIVRRLEDCVGFLD